MASFGDTDSEDPSDWSIDQVVHQFCSNPRPLWSPDKPAQFLKEPFKFEKALRDNDVDGETLLALDNAALKDDIGIASFGQRRMILKAIDILRNKSGKYQRASFHSDAISRLNSMPLQTPQMTTSRVSGYAQSPSLHGYGFQPPPETLQYHGSPAFNGYHFPRNGSPVGHPRPLLLQAGTACHMGPALEPLGPHPAGNPSNTADARDPLNDEENQQQNISKLTDETTFSNTASQRRVDTIIQQLDHKTDVEAGTSLLDVLEAGVDKSMLKERTNDDVVGSGLNKASGTLSRSKYLVVNGQKKIAPTFVSDISEDRANAHRFGLLPRANTGSDDLQDRSFYLHESAHEIADILYPAITDIEETFSFVSPELPSGQRQLIATLVKHALLQPIRALPGSGAKFKIPYSRSSLTSSDEPQYFTVFAPGLDPMVRNVDEYAAVKALQTGSRKQRRRTVKFSRPLHTETATDNPFQNVEINEDEDDTQYDYLLQKYPNKPDDDDLLPLFGESGDEGNYDEETWAEIQLEIEERSEDKGTGAMIRTQVEAAIEESINDLKAFWREKKLPKVQMKAFRLWTKAARDGRRQAEMDNATFWVNRFDSTIKKIKDEILKDVWHKSAEVKKQCQSLEESVFQREESYYNVQVLTETHPPFRPDTVTLLRAKTKERPQLPHGEELLESESEISLDDFIDDNSSEDLDSIPHDAPDPEVDASLALLREEMSRRRLLDNPVARGGSPELGLVFNENDDVLPDAPTESDIGSDSSEQMIFSPADRKRMSNNAGRLIQQELEVAFRIPPNPDDDTLSVNDLDEDDTKQGPDLDRPYLPQTIYREQGQKLSEAIDLTLSSSTSRAEYSDHESMTDFDVHTPDLNPAHEDDQHHQKLKLEHIRARMATSESSVSSPRLIINQPRDGAGLPDLEDVAGILRLDWDVIISESDRRRALAKAVYNLGLDAAKALRKHVNPSVKDPELAYTCLYEALVMLNQVGGMEGQPWHVEALPLLFVTFVCHANMMEMERLSDADSNEAYQALESASRPFFDCLCLALDAYSRYIPKKRAHDEVVDDSDLYEQSTDSDDRIVQDAGEPSSSKKRKRAVEESQEAKRQQMNDQVRVQGEEGRRAIMAKKLAAMDVTSDSPSAHVVNSMEPYITLHPHIGQRVKPHQVEGISFMWREIVNDPKQQGCLLAHTMGLGKTMQVISLLCTIAQTGSSADSAVRRQVPKRLRVIRALILCPPALIDNWYDELLMWVPNRVLGEVFRCVPRKERLSMIRTWAASGGVLLLSYDTFRALITNKAGKIDEYDHRELERNLLDVPNIIVADEAHKMKNAAAKITIVAKRFKSFSRIALTGSPLNNHLEEYHTMVDWIAPGYLGDMIQFKAKYSEPITDGLNKDSTAYEKRVMRRKLDVLKRDLAPKVCRADISAIEKDMPSKTEFFITVPLTSLQEKAYNICIDHIVKSAEKTSNARLWKWMAILSLLCHHPSCLVRKLKSQEDYYDAPLTTERVLKKTTDDDDSSVAPDDVALIELDTSADFRERAIRVFDEQDWSDLLGNVDLSYRTLIVQQIIEESLRIRDKVLIFSHSIPTLNYLEDLMKAMDCSYARIDGTTSMSKRQDATKAFNQTRGEQQVFLISMKAGGLGLNLQGANRVIIFDFAWNPSWEEQGIGRAYRLGQKKPVFVYRFRAGGTFEDILHNKSVFKTQLFERVVDKKNYMARAFKSARDYLFPTRDVPQQDFTESVGKDPEVLDLIIGRTGCIRNIELTETFQKDEDEDLTEEEQKAADEEYQDQVLERNDPEAYRLKKLQQQQTFLARCQQSNLFVATPGNLLNMKVDGITTRKPPTPARISHPPLPGMSIDTSGLAQVAIKHASLSLNDREHPWGGPMALEDYTDAHMPDTSPMRATSEAPPPTARQTDGANDEPAGARQPPAAIDKDDCKTQ